MKKNKGRRSKANIGFKGINLAMPVFCAAALIIIGIIIMLCSGSVYRYNWILLPRGAFPLSAFIITFITVIGLLGGAIGTVISERFYRKLSDKLIAVFALLGIAVLLFVWYNILFSSFAFFGAFLFSLLIMCCTVLAGIISFKHFKNCLLLLIPVILFSFYILWLSFSVMLIN